MNIDAEDALAPDVAVRALIGFEEELMQPLIDGAVHIGVVYTPQARPGLTVEPLLEERLVMITTQGNAAELPGPDYVYVDWGPVFFTHRSLTFPNFVGAAVTVNVDWLGLRRMLSIGGSGYFPVRVVREHELAGRVHRVAADAA